MVQMLEYTCEYTYDHSRIYTEFHSANVVALSANGYSLVSDKSFFTPKENIDRNSSLVSIWTHTACSIIAIIASHMTGKRESTNDRQVAGGSDLYMQ